MYILVSFNDYTIFVNHLQFLKGVSIKIPLPPFGQNVDSTRILKHITCLFMKCSVAVQLFVSVGLLINEMRKV